ncbi:hypothetical protein BD311DRAFT_772049 [Dichomitus squalens]|uniref:Uncharacterized protein n=1 Tax=Dichomitus squalens TaxID=114155 RepID=A0A4Q9M775_9APHY|nr:hypothetical protein BD311DRAFT_772049 [Dichomitus squalens]
MPSPVASEYTTTMAPEVAPVKLNTFALEIIQYFSSDAIRTTPQYTLSSLLFGALTTMFAASVFLLIRQRSLSQLSARYLLLSILILFSSTTMYMSTLIWNWSIIERLLSEANSGLFSDTYDAHESLAAFQNALHRQSTTASFALGANFIVGDAIVWWRACVIWRNKLVYFTALLTLTSTLATGTAGVFWASNDNPVRIVFMHGGDSRVTTAAGILSFMNNVTATSLIAYKAWSHRIFLRRHLGAEGAKTRLLRILALFVESGSLYCGLLTLIIAYMFDPAGYIPPGDAFNAMPYYSGGDYFVYGCLVPIVALYPITIIVIVALERSALELGSSLGNARSSPNARGPVAMSTVEFDPESTLSTSVTTQ